jgi:putative tricarboxylic transport membrane protein
MRREIRIGETILGLAVLALGLFIAIETLMTPPLAARTAIGPGVFPGLIGAGLIAVSIRLFYEALNLRHETENFPELDWKAVALLAGAFLLTIFIFEYVGWIIAGTILFCAGAYAFGSRRWVLNILLGLALTTITFFVFDYGLELDLPAGWLIEEAIIALGGDV